MWAHSFGRLLSVFLLILVFAHPVGSKGGGGRRTKNWSGFKNFGTQMLRKLGNYIYLSIYIFILYIVKYLDNTMNKIVFFKLPVNDTRM